MRVLVTGGAGFIGSNLALQLESEGHEVIIIDNLHSGKEENIKGFQGVVLKKDCAVDCEVEGQIDAVFHQAAITDPRYENEQETLTKNIEGFKKIIELAKEKNAKLVYASSASLYGNGPAPQKEDQKKDIMSVYAKSKLEMDEMALKLKDDMHIVGLRYFNVFGPNESLKGRPASMIYHLAKQMKQGNRPKIFKSGEHKRDHIYVKDCVRANILALDAPSGVYNVGTGIATSFNEIIALLNEIIEANFEPEYIENPYIGTYQNHTQADTSLAKEQLQFSAQYALKDAMKEYVNTL